MDEDVKTHKRGAAPPHVTLAHTLAVAVGSTLVGTLTTLALVGSEHSAASVTPQNGQTVEQNALDAREQRIISLVERASDAVVSVVVTKDVPTYERYYEEFDPFGGWGGFGGFQIPRLRERGTERREVGGGTGFFVSDDGLIVTNRHVVSDTEARYSVLLNDGSSHEARVLARDPVLDIAILKIDTAAPTYLRLGTSDGLRPGQTVIAIGNALGEFRNSVSVGVVSGLARSIVAGDGRGASEALEGVIQTDAAINTGNSGGPLLNLSGEVIGVNVAVAGNAENIGFAIPSSMVTRAVESVKTYGEIRRAYLGVRYVVVTPELAKARKLPVSFGALLEAGPDETALPEGSPAKAAGLVEGDLITTLGSDSLENRSLATLMSTRTPGERVTLTYYRNGERRSVEVTLGRMPDPQ